MPFGFRKGGGRGRGSGAGAGRRGGGRSFVENRVENCICPNCGTHIPHQRGMPCFQVKCPSCGSPMTRQFETGIPSSASTQGQISNKRKTPRINAELCTGCGKCVLVCPVNVISMAEGKAIINEVACNGCRLCVPACPESAIS